MSFVSVGQRRAVRRALQDISSGSPVLYRGGNTDENMQVAQTLHWSPDEEMIRARSRRRALCFYSGRCRQPTPPHSLIDSDIEDDYDGFVNETFEAWCHLKLPLNSTPRHYAHNADDDEDVCERPSKRRRCGDSIDSGVGSMADDLLADSSASLCLTDSHDTSSVFSSHEEDCPSDGVTCDVNAYLNKLSMLKRSICSSVPNRGRSWISNGKQDSYCYAKLKSQLNSFKSVCLVQLKQLISNTRTAAVEYVFGAWSIVSQLPEFAEPAQNSCTIQMHSCLAAGLLRLLKLNSWTLEELQNFRCRLAVTTKGKHVSLCVNYINGQLSQQMQ